MARSSYDFESLLSERVEEFVNHISELARRHAVETLSRALDGQVHHAGREGRKTSASSGRRSSDDVEKQADLLLGYIKKNPGKRAEEIAAEVGLSTKTLVLPMRKLAAAKKVKTQGQKRATRYFPSGAE